MRVLLCLCLAAALAACERPASGGPSTAGPFVPPPGEATVFPDLTGDALQAALVADYAPDHTLGYGPARDLLFRHEEDTDGALEDVYAGYTITLPPGADASAAAADLGVNTEHVWPQSYGARAEPLRSDMHHLFPVRDVVNSSRGNLPFGEVDDRQTEAWYRLDQSQSNTPAADLDAWSERGQGRFEPREAKEGDVARAVFYVYTLYRSQADANGGAPFFETMRDDLLRWNDLDPPDAAEVARSAWIAEQQGAPNPFVLDPTLARRLYATPAPDEPAAPTGGPASDLWLSEIHYDNVGADVGEGVEVSGPAGASLDGWRVVLYNGDGGTAYETVSLSGALPTTGAQWTAIPRIQNGSPDGVALVAPDGSARQFLSYEGAFVASDGPAQGRASEDLGVSEGPDTPVGRSLSRSSPEGPWRPGDASPGRR